MDSSDRHRIELCKQELSNLLYQERLAGASLLILANKQDVAGALSSQEIAQLLGVDTDDRYKNRHWSIQGCSAVTGDGLVDGINWVVDDIGSRIFMLG